MFQEITSVKAGDLSVSFCSLESGEGRSANTTKAFAFFLKTLRVKVYTKRVPETTIVTDAWSSDLFG